MTSWVDDIGHLLTGAGVGDYATDRALNPALPAITVAGLPPDPESALSLNPYPGPEPDTREGDEYPRLQVMVRATDPLVALDLDRAAYDALQATPGKYPAALTSGRWVLSDCYALQADPQPMGQDATGRWEFVRNYQLTVHTV